MNTMIASMSFLLGFLDEVKGFFMSMGDILFNLLILLIFVPIYLIFTGISTVSLFAETVFKKLAGIDTIYLGSQSFGGGNGNGQDLVYAFIKNNAVQNVFWSILGLSIILLFILTIVALIKSEFTLDLKGSAKGPIIARAFKSLVNFLVVPVVTLISIIGTNYLTTSIYRMFSPGQTTVVTKCFALGGYQANRVRRTENRNAGFYSFLQSGGDVDGEKLITGSDASSFFSGSKDAVATKIDNAFMEAKTLNLKFESPSFGDLIDANASGEEEDYVPFHTVILGSPDPDDNGVFRFSIWNPTQVNYFYDLFHFDYILALGSAIVMAWTLLTVCLVLVKRVFEMTILFLLAPPMTAIAPLDGGQAEKKWRQEFMKRLLSVIGPIFAYNMFFLIVPLFENISLFGSSLASSLSIGASYAGSASMIGAISDIVKSFTLIFDLFFQIVCILTGLSVVKSASALLSNLLGIDDLIKSGAENAKKAVDLGKKSFGLATAVGGVAYKGVAAAAKMGKGAMKGFANRAGKLQKKEDDAKSKLESATAEAKADGTLDEETEKAINEGTYEKGSGGLVADRIADLKKNSDEATLKHNNYITKKGNKAEKKASKKFDRKKDGISSSIEEEESLLKSNDFSSDREKKWHQDRLSKLKKQYADMGGDNAEETEKAKDKAINDARKKAWGKIQDGRNAPAGILAGIKAGYDSEYGEDSGKTNALGGMAKKVENLANKVKIPILGKRLQKTAHAATEYFNVSGDTATRRLNDMMAGIFGDGGGGELWKINFNKNARASLFEGVPEAKAREQGIQQNLLMAARKKYEDTEGEKALKEDKLKELAKYFAEANHDPKYEKLMKDRKQAEDMGNNLEVKKLDGKISDFTLNNGYMAKAREALKDKSFMASDEYKQFRDRIKDKAWNDERDKEVADKEYHDKMVASREAAGGKVVTKKDSGEREKDKEDIVNAVKQALEKGIRFDNNSLTQLSNAFAEGSQQMQAAILTAIQDALKNLPNGGGK